MSTERTYSLSGDFSGLKQDQLHTEIEEEAGITSTIEEVRVEGDVVTIRFATTLSGGEETTLDSLVSGHAADFTPAQTKDITVTMKKDEFNKTAFQKASRFAFPGSTHCTVTACAFMDPGVTSYDIQIFDRTNRNVIAQANFTNIEDEVVSLGAGANVPSTRAMFEVFVRKTGGSSSKVAHVTSVSISYA
jgi:hypothetical protein